MRRPTVADVTPTSGITPGTEVIDGVPLIFEASPAVRRPDEVVVRLPEHGVLVAQDLVYHRIHLFLGNNDIAGWQTAVEQLAADPAYDTILPGHGMHADRGVFAELSQYLADAQRLLGDDREAYKNAILGRYPDWRGAFLIDIGNQYLYGSQAG
jgi:glyoxylase-like metal-dependent hydrolase (beta-lactamase superfamily II)